MDYIQTVIGITIIFFLAQYYCLYYYFKEEYYTRIENFDLKYELTTPYALLIGALGSYLVSQQYDFMIIGTITLLIVLLFYKTIFQKDLKIFTDYFIMLILVFIAFIIIFEVFSKSYSNGVSMEGTIKDKQGYYVNNIAYGIRNTKNGKYLLSYAKPQRGDIITFNVFKNTSNKILKLVVKESGASFEGFDFIVFSKRIVALPGDKYFMKNERFYLHPHEGNDYIKEHYKGYERLTIQNEIYVKDPYLKDFPKIQFTTDDPVYKEFKKISTNLFDSNITTIPQNHYFVLGDNRNVSCDSRLFGSIPFDWITGKIIKILPQ